jgi:hypothetical protein
MVPAVVAAAAEAEEVAVLGVEAEEPAAEAA